MNSGNTQNQQRFIQLVEQYQESVLRTCYLYLRDQSLAEDAVQETFLKVYRKIGTFRGECSEKSWIMKIAMHVCYDMKRSAWFRLMNRFVTPEMLPEQDPDTYDERDEALTMAVMMLPPKLREVILLYYYQGMNVNEIAETLNIAHSSVSGRLQRGRKRLKKLLEGSDLDA